jgi:OmpA-OmpF porin, OOP family
LVGLDQLAKLESGTAAIDAKKLVVAGMASSEAIANAAKDVVAKGAGSLVGESKITFRPAPVVAPAPAAPTPAPVVAAPAVPAAPAPAAPAPKAPAVAVAPVAPAAPVAAPKAATPAPATPVPAPAAVASSDTCEQDLGTAMKASRILFGSSSAALRRESQPVLLQIAAAIKRCGTRKIEISGHTDSTGTLGFNETLSKNRAKAVADALVKTGIPMAQLQVAGYGPAKPVATNDTEAGKLQNRRIEFTVIR